MLSVTAAFYSEKTEQIMNKIATTALVLGLTAGTAFAGGYVAPVVEAEPAAVEESAASSAAGWVVPALLVLGIAAALASNDDDHKK